MNENMNQPSAPSGVFVSTLAAMHSGKVLTDLDEALRDVTKHVNQSQAKGKLVLELTVSPNGLGVGEIPLFKVSEKVKATLPKSPRPGQSFFADHENNLTRRNPSQEEMTLSLVSSESPSAKVPALKSSSQ